MKTRPSQLLTLCVQLVGESEQFPCRVERGGGGGEGRGGHHNVAPEEQGWTGGVLRANLG